MKQLRAYPALALVLAANLLWTVISAISTDWGNWLWNGEQSPVEIIEVVFLCVCILAWGWITARLRQAGARRLQRVLAALMVGQLALMVAEELDWFWMLGPYRNFREILHLILPQVLDSPAAAAYLLLFVFAPIVPLPRVQRWLEQAAPIRAQRADTWAALAIPACWGPVYLAVGDQTLGELHQVGIYAIVGVITVRIVREIGAK